MEHNYWLAEQLTKQRYDDMRREAAHDRLLAEHGLDLWSVLRRAIGARSARRTVAMPERIEAPAEEMPTRIAA